MGQSVFHEAKNFDFAILRRTIGAWKRETLRTVGCVKRTCSKVRRSDVSRCVSRTLPHQLQHAPQRGVFPERKLRADAQRLFAQLFVAHRVVEPQPRMLLRIEAVEGGGRQKRFQVIPASPST